MASYDLLPSLARLLRITIALALPFSLAFLRPRLLLAPPPIFILANLLVLAIALSSRFPHPLSCPLLRSPPSHSLHPFSPLPIPLPYALPKKNLPPRYVLQRQTQQRRQHRRLSKALAKPAPLAAALHLLSSDRQSVTFSHAPAPSQITAEVPTRLGKKVGPSIPPAPQMQQVAICEELHHREQQRAVNAEAAQKKRMVAVRRLARSKSDPTMCASETAPKFIRKTVNMNSAIDMMSMVFENIIDEDFCKRCAKFIANNHEKWRKESLERML